MKKLIQKIKNHRDKKLRKKLVFYLIQNMNHKPDLTETFIMAENAVIYINKGFDPFADALEK